MTVRLCAACTGNNGKVGVWPNQKTCPVCGGSGILPTADEPPIVIEVK